LGTYRAELSCPRALVAGEGGAERPGAAGQDQDDQHFHSLLVLVIQQHQEILERTAKCRLQITLAGKRTGSWEKLINGMRQGSDLCRPT
jgi:hypothetical protein